MNHVRTDYPILKQTVNDHPLRYLDNASTLQKPQAVIDAVTEFYTTYNANTFRGLHAFGEQATHAYESARATVAQFIHARDTSEIVFTRGCTESINFVAATWGRTHLKPGDEIVITQLEHHANILPWRELARTHGVVIRVIPVNKHGLLDMPAAQKLINKKTKLVSVLDVSNAIGTTVDVAQLGDYARAVGAKFLIDAAQSIAHKPFDVQILQPDFVVFSGHKLGAPTGIGILYIKKELHDDVPPYQFGGGMVRYVGPDTQTWAPAPHKYEAGTPPIAQAIGLGAAIKYIQRNIDFSALEKHEAQLCSHLINGLQKLHGVRILGPIEQLKQQGHVVSFVLPAVHAHDTAAYLSNYGICVRAGNHCAQPLADALGYQASLRASFYAYNTQDDVDALVRHLDQLIHLDS